ncbi:MAG: hypothetical protein ACI9UA_000464 [Pseudoalteromonas tetraodonis]|jgi:hypothetical protein
MWRRSQAKAYATFLLLVIALALPIGTARADDERVTTAEVEESCKRAAKYLLSQQFPNGCFQELRRMDRQNKDKTPRQGVTMSALAIMGLASIGHQPTDPTDEGKAMRKALEFVLDERHQFTDKDSPHDGYFGKADQSRMYGHGIITLMLAEMLGMGVDEEMDYKLHDSCQRAIDLILRSQKVKRSRKDQGGWRYEPGQADSDLSVTVWQLMALRAAKNAGLEVPTEAIESGVQYVRNCYYSRYKDGKPIDENRGFGYEAGGAHKFSTTAEGLLSMQVCGQYEAPEVIGAANYLLENGPRWGDEWFFYGTYYYAQGMAQRGGEFASTSKQKTAVEMLKRQARDGSWKSGEGQGAGTIYSTSLALLSLSIHHNYLPIYQR